MPFYRILEIYCCYVGLFLLRRMRNKVKFQPFSICHILLPGKRAGMDFFETRIKYIPKIAKYHARFISTGV